MASSFNFVKTGKVVGTGADKKIVLGFQPRMVELFNADNTGGKITAWKTDQMATRFAKKVIANGTTTFADDMCVIESDGFTIGDDSDLNAAGEDIYYIAWQGKND
jgi:hypothetical protein